MECPDENIFAEFSQGLLPDVRGRDLEDHLDRCGRCRALLVAVSRSASDGKPARVSGPVLGDIIAEEYRVERVIGAGGMGVVVEATHLLLDRKVALKLMHVDGLASPEAIERFMREARATVQLESEHAARVMDLGILPSGAPFFVMEHLEGEDTSRLVRRDGPLDARTAALYIIQACEAVAEAHRLGIIHRDLKPSNLFVTRRADGTPSIKVVDFGLSKIATERELSLTHSHAVLGSPFFMAPEQLLSAREVDARADVWALGATLQFLLTGKPPFDAVSLPELSAAVLRDSPRPLPREVPPALAQIVTRCLDKDPTTRFESASELARELAPFAKPAEITVAQPQPFVEHRRRWPQIGIVVLAAAAIAAGSVLAMTRGPHIDADHRARRAATSLEHPPVVLLMDTSAGRGLYDGDTPAGSTNADVISDLLHDLPITIVKETLNSSWDRETMIAQLHPDLVVIHRSAFFHALNEEFKLGYPAHPDPAVDTQWFRLYNLADDKLKGLLGTIGTTKPDTRFLVYSRGTDGRWPSAKYRKEWVTDLATRFPALEGHVTTMLIAGGVEGGSFKNPIVGGELRSDVQAILGLP